MWNNGAFSFTWELNMAVNWLPTFFLVRKDPNSRLCLHWDCLSLSLLLECSVVWLRGHRKHDCLMLLDWRSVGIVKEVFLYVWHIVSRAWCWIIPHNCKYTSVEFLLHYRDVKDHDKVRHLFSEVISVGFIIGSLSIMQFFRLRGASRPQFYYSSSTDCVLESIWQ